MKGYDRGIKRITVHIALGTLTAFAQLQASALGLMNTAVTAIEKDVQFVFKIDKRKLFSQEETIFSWALLIFLRYIHGGSFQCIENSLIL